MPNDPLRFAFPVTLDVTGRRCVVVGGGRIAAEKAAALVDAGAEIVEVPANGYHPELLDGAFVAISTGEDGTDPTALHADAEARGVLVNVMDDVDRCHFAFPSIVRRGELRVAISTGGTAPALARRLRLHLDQALPETLGGLVELVGEARERTLPRTVEFGEWAARWREAVDDLDALLRLVEQGRVEEARERIVATVTGAAP